jgi:hypothetical protein
MVEMAEADKAVKIMAVVALIRAFPTKNIQELQQHLLHYHIRHRDKITLVAAEAAPDIILETHTALAAMAALA